MASKCRPLSIFKHHYEAFMTEPFAIIMKHLPIMMGAQPGRALGKDQSGAEGDRRRQSRGTGTREESQEATQRARGKSWMGWWMGWWRLVPSIAVRSPWG